MGTAKGEQRCCGRRFTAEEVTLIQEVVSTCDGISRTELAHTVCELLEWKRAGGGLKATECREWLEQLESQGVLSLPVKRPFGLNQCHKSILPALEGEIRCELTGRVEEFAPVEVELVQSAEERKVFRELLSKYHYLGYARPYGARLRYLCYVSRPRREVVGCVQFSSPAWRMKPRDQWIGWDDAVRARHLQHVVNNSRFLVLGKIQNLASALLSGVLKRLRSDWQRSYGVDPLLVETLVDGKRFHGGCYRAANFVVVGETSGRGRMDRTRQREGAEVKTVMLYPLVKDAAKRLREVRGG